MAPPHPKWITRIVGHRNDELRGRFANTFTVHYNGDNYAWNFYIHLRVKYNSYRFSSCYKT